ncbi:MAG: peptide chain release factor-like protein [PVC group bacterium]|nr:peptide chain release factor-like protein [PVC group bacterium]
MSLSKFGVSQEKIKMLLDLMDKLNIKEADLEEQFIRAQGPGGQKVNKTSTCVYLKHIPTRVEVKCQRERSQALNRFLARKTLAKKIENLLLGKKSDEQKRIAKIKRQKRKRSKRAQEKVLKLKKIHGEKKKFRSSKIDIEKE